MTSSLPRLLIVDDEEQIRRLITEFLEDYEEFEVRGAGSGEAGLEVLAQAPADLCVVDLRLPGMNGEAFILAAHGRGLCPRFLLHTGSVDHTLSDELCAAGVTEQDVFIKPNDLERLVERIRELLQSPAA
jgi:DNA-binding response OmpR family regulator